MTTTHRARVQATLAEAAANHAALLERLPPEMRATLPVDAQGFFYINWELPPTDARLTADAFENLLRQDQLRTASQPACNV